MFQSVSWDAGLTIVIVRYGEAGRGVDWLVGPGPVGAALAGAGGGGAPNPCAPVSSICRAPGTGVSEKCTVPLASTQVHAGAPLTGVTNNVDSKISHLGMLQA
jgi:hypothetical protein